MGRPCTACHHPDRASLDAALSAGMAYRNIVARFGIGSTRTLTGHRAHLMPATNRNAQAFPEYRNTIHCLRDEDLLSQLADRSIDAWWGSPPYNLADRFRGGNSTTTKVRSLYADSTGRGDGNLMPEPAYQAWQVRVLNEWHRTLTDDGVAYYSHKPRHKSGRFLHPRTWVERSKFVVIGEIVWARPGTAQCDPRRLYPSYEVVLILAKRPGLKLVNRGRESGGEGLGDVWYDVLPEGKRASRGHPCTTPQELVRRCLSVVPPAPVGRRLLVADCYAGSGTTGYVARALGMDYLLSDQAPEYVTLARQRLAAGATNAAQDDA